MDFHLLNEVSPMQFSVQVKIEEADTETDPASRKHFEPETSTLSAMSHRSTLRVEVTRLPNELLHRYMIRNNSTDAGSLPTNNRVSRKTAVTHATDKNITSNINLINENNFISRKEKSMNTKHNRNNTNIIKETDDKEITKLLLDDKVEPQAYILKDNQYIFNTDFNNKSIGLSAGKYVCPKCKYITKNSLYFEYHLKAHSAAKKFICNTCHYIATYRDCIKNHLKIHSGKKLICEICDKKFLCRQSLTSHIRIHTNERPYACQICDKTFAQGSSLSSHMKIHTGEKPHACNTCGKKFGRRNVLTCHILTAHTNMQKAYSCNICEKKFILKKYLHKHIEQHTSKGFSCDICDATLSSKYKLKLHLRIHTTEKPYTCEQCNRKFRRREHLNVHRKKIHEKEKRFVCGNCDCKFPYKCDLNNHIKTHNPPYVCNVCNKQFKFFYGLIEHFRKCQPTTRL